MAPRIDKAAISQARQVCQSIIDCANDIVLVISPKSLKIMDANKRAAELYGYSRQELKEMNIAKLTGGHTEYYKFPHGGRSRTLEATHITRKGEKLELSISLSLIDYWGRKAILSVGRDIREHKRMECALRVSEKKMRSLIQNSSDIIALVDAQGVILFVSPQVEHVLGFHPSELLKRNVFEFVHPEDIERAKAEFTDTIQHKGEGIPSMLRLRDDAGKWIPFEIIAKNQLDDPDIGGVIFTARDLRFRREAEKAIQSANRDVDKRVEERTMELAKANATLRIEVQERRFAEKRLEESLSLLQGTLDSTTDGILVVSMNGQITSYNKRFIEMWNFPKSALLKLRDDELLSVAVSELKDPKAFLQKVRDLYAEPEVTSFDVLKFKDGRVFERYSQPQRVGEQIVGRVWSFRDVTQTKQMEEELRQSQKMEAIGRLAGGVAHDFNNVLMLISGNAAQLLEEPDLPSSMTIHAEEIIQATKRAASLTRQLLAFSRKQPLARRVVDLNLIISDMERMLKRLLSEEIEVAMHLSDEPLPVYADPSQIDLIIMNLAINSRDAMPGGGVMSIKTGEQNTVGSIKDNGAPGEFVFIEISDTGVGIPTEIQSHIFEPFFTTKEVGKGTGLGLSTIYGIVQQSGGHITVQSEPDRGTTFKIYLPKAETAAPQRANVRELAIQRTGNETILLVEDEDGIRAMMRVYLEGLGYKVLEAASGAEAIVIAEEYPGRIQLLVTDIVMPGMKGTAVATEIGSHRKDIKILFVSGYAEKLDPNVPVLEKPFSFPELGTKVRSLLDTALPGKTGESPEGKVA